MSDIANNACQCANNGTQNCSCTTCECASNCQCQNCACTPTCTCGK